MRRQKKQQKKIIPLFLILLFSTLLLFTGFLFKKELQAKLLPSQNRTETVNKSNKVSKNTTNQAKKRQSLSNDSQTWIKKTSPVKVPILMYHAIHVMAPEEAANANLIVAPDLFESQIKALKEAGYYFLTPEETYRVLTKNEVPSEKIVWLTFDDSMIDFYHAAYPILKKYNAKATNNVITGLTEKASVANLTVPQMKEMKEHGMSFQDHTVNHPDLSQQDSATQELEMKDSMVYLNQELDQKTIAIAYPAGRYNETTLDIAKQLDYQLGLTTNEGLASADDGLLSLNRVRILPNTSAEILLSQIKIP